MKNLSIRDLELMLPSLTQVNLPLARGTSNRLYYELLSHCLFINKWGYFHIDKLIAFVAVFICRYKKLLSSVDLTKDFFYSYTYPIMQSLQKNAMSTAAEGMPYDNIFVWNAYLTRAIRSRCNNTAWTIALVHGHFKQVCKCCSLLLTSFGCCAVSLSLRLLVRRPNVISSL